MRLAPFVKKRQPGWWIQLPNLMRALCRRYPTAHQFLLPQVNLPSSLSRMGLDRPAGKRCDNSSVVYTGTLHFECHHAAAITDVSSSICFNSSVGGSVRSSAWQ